MFKRGISIKGSEKLSLLSNFSTMITAGIPILETVDSLLEDAKGNTRKLLMVIREDILQGNHLYSSFSKFPGVFDKVTINVIRAAEEAGTLDVTLADIKEQIEREMEFNDRIRSAMVYPVVILFVFLGVFFMILTFVIPKVAKVFTSLNVDLPLPTRVLIFLSDLILHNTVFLIGGFAIFVLLFIFLLKTQRKKILGIFYKIPIISNLVREIDLAHFSRSMYLLLNSGITITNALELAEEVVIRPDIAKAIRHAQETVLTGKNLSQGFRDNKKVFRVFT